MGHRGKNDLLRLLSTFADNYIDKTDIAQSDWSSSIGSWKEKRKFGFNLMLQIISAAYADLLEDQTEKKSTNQSRILFGQHDVIDGETTAKDVTKDKSFVPDTMDLVVANNVKVKMEDATCRWVPETQLPAPSLDVESEEEIFKTPDQRNNSKRLAASFKPKLSPPPKTIREASDKYSPLTCLTKEAKHETTLKVGALGTGSISSFAPPAPLATSTQLPLPFGASDNESPSIINPLNFGRGSKNADVPVSAKKVKRSGKRIRDKSNLDCEIDELDDDDDDFKTDERVIKKTEAPSHLPETSYQPEKKPKLSKKTGDVKVLNRFGIDVSETTLSQKKRNSRLKQQGIMQYVKGPNSTEGTSSERKLLTSFGAARDLDVELEMAKALSLETKRLEDEQRPKRTEPRTPLKKLLEDESLDNLPRAKVDIGHKFVDTPVRKKAERKGLPAFECADCRNYYAGANLDENQLQELLQQCSRHRSKNPPPPSSPKTCWELDIKEDSSQNKTQAGPPLRTRKSRPALKKRRNIADDEDFEDISEDSQII